jgi:hypothetical protein
VAVTPVANFGTNERRAAGRGDRRKQSRNGRRSDDPRGGWRQLAWLFAAYAAYLSVRSIPEKLRHFFGRYVKHA